MATTLRQSLTALGCLVAFASAPAATASAKTLDLVVAGDDYAAGPGPGADACGRSTSTWGARYASALRRTGTTVNFRNLACSGATVPDLDTQLLSVKPTTDLVALTIGGNDLGFAQIVLRCFTPYVSDPVACEAAVTAAQDHFPNLGPSLRALKTRLRAGGKVVVVSYPYLARPSGYLLTDSAGHAYDAGFAVRSLGDTLDFIDANAVDLTNAQYRDNAITFLRTKLDFAGHEPDQKPLHENAASWIWEFTGISSPLDIYRLKPSGQQKIADLMLAAGGPGGDFGAAE